MRKARFVPILGTVLILPLALAPWGQASASVNAVVTATPATKRLDDSINQVSVTPPVGPINPHHPTISRVNLTDAEQNTTLDFEISLRMRNFAELQDRAGRGEQISDAEKQAKYFPLAADYQKVVDWAQAQGFEIIGQDSSHLAVFVRAPIKQIASHLKCSFARVKLEKEEWTSATSPPEVPQEIAATLIGIHGLQPHLHLHSRAILKNAFTPSVSAPYTVSQIAHAYNIDSLYSSGIKGSGQCVAIIDQALPQTSDLTAFWNANGISQSLSNFTFTQVVSGTLPGPTGEETLDAEIISGLAPAAKVRMYATTSLSYANVDQGYLKVYSDAVNHTDYQIHSLSLSFAGGELNITQSQLQSDSQYMANLASSGVSVFASSGDQGAYLPYGATYYEAAEQPASLANVTGVGGTSLYLDNNGNVSSETSWGNSGGGPSVYVPRPSYQFGPGIPTGLSRLVPDVAAIGDTNTGAQVYYNGSSTYAGGTSLSVLIWSASAALVQQKRAAAGQGAIGNWNGRLYALIGTSSFRDITTGGSNGYQPQTGYDLVTGCGVPNMQALAQALAGSAIANTYGGTLTQMLHIFADGGVPYDGKYPIDMILAPNGSFYGICNGGGYTQNSSNGVVFKMSTTGQVSYVHGFNDGYVTNDGYSPAQGLAIDSSNNFYGTTYSGGVNGNGVLYQTSSSGTTTILHAFNYSGEPSTPATGVTLGQDGNLYGISGNNYFWKSTPGGSFSVISSGLTISNNSAAINYVYTSPLVLGKDGNFYGTMSYIDSTGFNEGFFSLTPSGTLTLKHTFNGTTEGAAPTGKLYVGSDGSIYGALRDSPANQTGGVIYKMTTQGTFTVLHDFSSNLSGGYFPAGGLTIGADGYLYGATTSGGTANSGTLFRIGLGATPTFALLHNFDDGSVANEQFGPSFMYTNSSGYVEGLLTNSPSSGSAPGFGSIYQVDFFTNPNTATFLTGTPNTFTFAAVAMPSATYTATGLPSWATLNSSTGVLSGNPPTNSVNSSPYTITVKASDSNTVPTITETFTLNVANPVPPQIVSSPISGTYYIGNNLNQTISVTGTPTPTLSVTSGSLPPGVTLSSSGLLSGTTTAFGLYTGTITASNGYAPNASQSFSIEVDQAPTFTNTTPSPTLTVGSPYSYTFTATGYPTPTFSANSLPSWLTLSSNGVLSGTPPANTSGVYNVTITATNNTGGGINLATQYVTITVNGPPYFSNSTQSLTGYTQLPYSFTFTANGTPAAATYSLASGSTLPAGLTLSSSGVLSGTPTKVGTTTFTIQAANGYTPNATQTVTFTTVASVAPYFSAGTPPVATVNYPYNFTYYYRGTPVPNLYANSGSIPPGTVLYTLSTNGYVGSLNYPGAQLQTDGSGVLSVKGTPTQVGSYTISLQASNGIGSTVIGTIVVNVQSPQSPVLTNGQPPIGTVSLGYDFFFTASGGPPPTFTLASGTLPPGLSLASSGELSGTPTTTGTYTFSVLAVNGYNPAATASYTVKIQTLTPDTEAPTLPAPLIVLLGTLLFGLAARAQLSGKAQTAR